jgi:hypothetical protein
MVTTVLLHTLSRLMRHLQKKYLQPWRNFDANEKLAVFASP